MATFGFNSAAQVVKARELGNLPTEFNNIIQYYNCIKRSMIDSTVKTCGTTTQDQVWDVYQLHIMEQHQMMQNNRP